MIGLNELIGTLNDYYAGQFLVIAGLALIWVDFYFPIDGPCHFGYRAIEIGVFLLLPFSVVVSAAIALGIWIVFELLHMIWLDDLLENETEGREDIPAAGDAAPA